MIHRKPKVHTNKKKLEEGDCLEVITLINGMTGYGEYFHFLNNKFYYFPKHLSSVFLPIYNGFKHETHTNHYKAKFHYDSYLCDDFKIIEKNEMKCKEKNEECYFNNAIELKLENGRSIIIEKEFLNYYERIKNYENYFMYCTNDYDDKVHWRHCSCQPEINFIYPMFDSPVLFKIIEENMIKLTLIEENEKTEEIEIFELIEKKF